MFECIEPLADLEKQGPFDAILHKAVFFDQAS
jgi:hypothetical protein